MTANNVGWGSEDGWCNRNLFCFVTAAVVEVAFLQPGLVSLPPSVWIFIQSPGHPELSDVSSHYATVVEQRQAGPGLLARPAAVIRPCLCLQAACFHCKRHCSMIRRGEDSCSQGAGGQILAYLDFSSISLKNFGLNGSMILRLSWRIYIRMAALVKSTVKQWEMTDSMNASFWFTTCVDHISPLPQFNLTINLEWAVINCICGGSLLLLLSLHFSVRSTVLLFKFLSRTEDYSSPSWFFFSCQTFIFSHAELRNPQGLSQVWSRLMVTDSSQQKRV